MFRSKATGVIGRSPRTRQLFWLAALTPVVALLYGTTTALPAMAAAPGAPSGWSTVFSDDFIGPFVGQLEVRHRRWFQLRDR
jgi:hypothetical protein